MLKFILFLGFGFITFSLSLIGYKKYKATTLYALAIGGVVNANFFHAGAYPVTCFGLPFGIDSLIYTLFVFCVMVMLLHETKRDAYLLAVSSIVAILFSACMQLVADLLSIGSSVFVWQRFAGFCISAFASIIAILVAVEIVSRMKAKHNAYLCMAVGIIITILLNSGIYYPLSVLINVSTGNVWLYLATSFLGKLIALGYSLLAFFYMQMQEKKKSSSTPDNIQ